MGGAKNDACHRKEQEEDDQGSKAPDGASLAEVETSHAQNLYCKKSPMEIESSRSPAERSR